MAELFVGRQPIYDRELKVVGYELLYRRDPNINRAEFSDVDQACSQVLLDTLVEVGIENLVGNHLAFMNLSQSFLVGNYDIPIPHKQVVVEVLEDVVVDGNLVERIEELHEQGLTIALDDFIYSENLKPLLKRAQIVKVDILQLSRHELAEYVTMLKYNSLKILAEKVETHDDFEFCMKLGFDYFQGYFFCKPRIVQGRSIPANKLSLIELLNKINSPEVDFRALSQIIRRDIALSYKVLRLINSAYYSLPNRVSSIEQALMFLGLKNLTNLISLIKLARIDEKPPELTVTAMIRGKMCEELAERMRLHSPQQYFTAGLFSALDALLDAPMNEVLSLLPLSEEINDALTEHKGPIGRVLKAVLGYERAVWEDAVLEELPEEAVRDSYFKAVAWADELNRQIRSNE